MVYITAMRKLFRECHYKKANAKHGFVCKCLPEKPEQVVRYS